MKASCQEQQGENVFPASMCISIYMFSHIQIMEMHSDDLEWRKFSHFWLTNGFVMSRGREAGASP